MQMSKNVNNDVSMNPPISKTDCCVDRSIHALLSAYQEYPVTLMTSQVVQSARPEFTYMRRWQSKG